MDLPYADADQPVEPLVRRVGGLVAGRNAERRAVGREAAGEHQQAARYGDIVARGFPFARRLDLEIGNGCRARGVAGGQSVFQYAALPHRSDHCLSSVEQLG